MARPKHRHDTFHRGNVPEDQLGTGTATDGHVLTATATGTAAWEVATGGAPADADYLVGTANGTLSGEIVVGTTPGGELGGTWASPTVDASHSGSTHAATQAAAEATASTALSSHAADADLHGGGGEILILDTPAGSPLVFADLIQNEAGTDLLYEG